ETDDNCPDDAHGPLHELKPAAYLGTSMCTIERAPRCELGWSDSVQNGGCKWLVECRRWWRCSACSLWRDIRTGIRSGNGLASRVAGTRRGGPASQADLAISLADSGASSAASMQIAW